MKNNVCARVERVTRVVVKVDKNVFIWDKAWSDLIAKGEFAGDLAVEIRKEYQNVNVKFLSGVHNLDELEDGVCALFWVSDCFDPPVYLVGGSCESDAHDNALCHMEDLMKVHESDWPDYEITHKDGSTETRLSCNDNGVMLDTELLQMNIVRTITITSDINDWR